MGIKLYIIGVTMPKGYTYGFSCGHTNSFLPNTQTQITRYIKNLIIEWKYSVGTKGNRSQCFECWIKKKYKGI